MVESSVEKRGSVPGAILVAVGLCLTVVGVALPQFMPATVYWSEEDAQEFAQAAASAHEASIPGGGTEEEGHEGHSHGDASAEDLAAAKARLEESEQRLEKARQMQGYTGPAIAIAGVVASLAGLALMRARG